MHQRRRAHARWARRATIFQDSTNCIDDDATPNKQATPLRDGHQGYVTPRHALVFWRRRRRRRRHRGHRRHGHRRRTRTHPRAFSSRTRAIISCTSRSIFSFSSRFSSLIRALASLNASRTSARHRVKAARAARFDSSMVHVDDFRETLLEWLDLDSSHRETFINNLSRVELGLGPVL